MNHEFKDDMLPRKHFLSLQIDLQKFSPATDEEKQQLEEAYRAVGLANNRNPIAILIPCHRVIGSNGTLVGYAGGLSVKERLLQLEAGDRMQGKDGKALRFEDEA